jgi:hypothetical protein
MLQAACSGHWAGSSQACAPPMHGTSQLKQQAGEAGEAGALQGQEHASHTHGTCHPSIHPSHLCPPDHLIPFTAPPPPLNPPPLHRPEQWGYLVFLPQGQAPQQQPAVPDPALAARRAAMEVYHLQRDYHKAKGGWAASLEVGLLGSDAVERSYACCASPCTSLLPTLTPCHCCHRLQELAIDPGSYPAGVQPPTVQLAPGGADYTVSCRQKLPGGGWVTAHTRSDSLQWVEGAAASA